MQYEMKEAPDFIGAPKEKNSTAYTQCISIVTGIVGQIYNGFINKDTTIVEFPATGLDADGIKALILSAATNFVATKYPNT